VSLIDVEMAIYRLKSEPDARDRFGSEPDKFLAETGMPAKEARMLRDGDIAALWKLGVHPLLLVSYARAVGYSPKDYDEALASCAGIRKFVS
jgi:hypothetical protein